MKKIIFLLLLTGIVFTIGTGAASAGETLTMTILEAVSFAFEHNPAFLIEKLTEKKSLAIIYLYQKLKKVF